MAFYSVAFFCFVTVFLILHELTGRLCPKYQWIIRLLAGLTFYTYISGFRIVFVIASALSIWKGSLLIGHASSEYKSLRKSEGLSKEDKNNLKAKYNRKKKLYVATVIVFNLAILIITKYFLPVAGHPIALPVGISFYTLMAVSYIVDIYGAKYEPQDNPAKVMLYLCWFPQLVQGPINRYDLVSSDLYKNYKLTAPAFRYAFYCFLFGAVKKYAIADLLAPMVNSCLNNDSASYPGSYLVFGALMFAIEQYADFSGGIDMAMGVSLLFGIKMNDNFRQPYFSTSLAQFWRRWHITLGSFMRDYVFYPFVTTKPVSKLNKVIAKRFGNHAARTVIGGISNLLVFALVGLWHGPEKHYLMWGLYNGFIIAISDGLAPVFSTLNRKLGIEEDNKGLYCFRVVRTFAIIVFAGYFDVIGPVHTSLACFVNTVAHFDLRLGLQMIGQMVSDNITSPQAIVTALIAVILLVINSVLKEKGRSPLQNICSRFYLLRWVVCFSLMVLLLYSFTVSSGIQGFMYAAF